MICTSVNASATLLLGGLLSKRDHELVPAHAVLSRSEVTTLLNTLGLNPNNLPKILLNDPQVTKIGAKVGDVIEIERVDFGKSFKYYRLVVQS